MKNKLFAVLMLGLLGSSQTFYAFAEEPARDAEKTTTLIDGKKSEMGFKSIFNGKDLTGWDGSPELWSVKDGAIVGQTTLEHPAKENTFLIWTNGTVGDFEFRCSFKLTPGDSAGFANSGVQYRSRQVPSTRTHQMEYWVVSGYQADMEAGASYTGICYEEKARGILATRGEKVIYTIDGKKQLVGCTVPDQVNASVPVAQQVKKAAAEIEASLHKGDWNDYIIRAKGNHLLQIVNGHVTVDITDEEEAKAAKSGILALQLHAGHPMMVEFKNLRLKTLK